MDLCLIPPIPHLKQFKQSRHLVLSHLLQHKEYREFYEARRNAGDFIILDNSAHENGIGEGAGKLLLQVQTLNPQEVVVPDALEDGPKTVAFARSALISWFGSEGRLRERDIRLMYVPQGKNFEEWERCLTDLMVLHNAAVNQWKVQEGCTIGISKDYADWDGGLERLLHYVVRYLGRPGYEVHLLGSGHRYWEARDLGKEFQIRSIDTAKPFVWAYNGLVMTDRGPHPLAEKLPKRPPNYFHYEFQDQSLMRHNADVLRRLIEG